MSRANTIPAGGGTDRTVSAVSEMMTERSAFFATLMLALRRRSRGAKVAEMIADITGCHPRTAARFLAGERMPGGDETVKLLYGRTSREAAIDALIAEARRALPAADFDAFVREMAKATLRALVREEIGA